MFIPKRDLFPILSIGALIGILIQPILSNNAEQISSFISLESARVIVFFGFFILAPLALSLAAFIGKFIPVLYQFAKFAAVGTLNSMVDLGFFNLALFLYGVTPSQSIFILFKGMSFFVSTTNSFFWNKFWTFHAAHPVNSKETFKFYSVAISGGVINIVAATAVFQNQATFVSIELWTSVIAPVCGILAASLWNFIGYKYLVFKERV